MYVVSEIRYYPTKMKYKENFLTLPSLIIIQSLHFSCTSRLLGIFLLSQELHSLISMGFFGGCYLQSNVLLVKHLRLSYI